MEETLSKSDKIRGIGAFILIVLMLLVVNSLSYKDPINPTYVGDYYIEGEYESPSLSISKSGEYYYLDITLRGYTPINLVGCTGVMTSRGIDFTGLDSNGNEVNGLMYLEGNTACVLITQAFFPQEIGTIYRYNRNG